MHDVYDKCSKQIYDTVSQLMKLADEDNCGGFLALAKENKALLGCQHFLFEIAVTVGLMARNKADILEKFIENIVPDKTYLYSAMLCHFAGILIRKQRCREAVKRFILKLPEKVHNEHILLSAVMVDDLEFFKLLYDFGAFYTISLLIGGIFKSKKILDFITNCGGDFLNENMPCEVNFDVLLTNNEGYPICFSDGTAENDMLLKWLKNIYYMYFSNETPEKSYEILEHIAQNTAIDLFGRNNTFSNSIYNKAIIRKIFILKLCGVKANDLTCFIPRDEPFYTITDKDIDAVAEIAGNAPFITYEDCFTRNDDFVIKLAKKLDNTLTVNLITDFSAFDIEKLQDKVRIEIDAENPKTAKYLCNIFTPYGIMIDEQKKSNQNAVKYFIDNGFITVEKMAEIASLAQNTDILNMLFNYGDKEGRPAKKQKGAR